MFTQEVGGWVVCLYIVSRVDSFLFPRLPQRHRTNLAIKSHRCHQDRAIPGKWVTAYDWHYSSCILGRVAEMINPTSLGRPWACPNPALKYSHTHMRACTHAHTHTHSQECSCLLRYPTSENCVSFRGRVRNCSYNLFFSIQLINNLQENGVFVGGGKGTPGNCEGVGEGKHNEERALEGWAQDPGRAGAQHSMQRTKVKTWVPPGYSPQQGCWECAQPCPNREQKFTDLSILCYHHPWKQSSSQGGSGRGHPGPPVGT